ncbi:MAG TPA: hypothetical protein VGI45_00755 [Terracidiphilus sp.]|jgi:hypothetical protein
MRYKALATYLLGFSLQASFGQTPALPVQAEILKPVQVPKVATGATVLAKVTAEWNGPGCVLHTGAVLEGRVETSEPRKSGSRSMLALSFDRAQCNGSDLRTFPLVLVAAAAPPNDWQDVPDVEINSPRLRAHPGGEPSAPAGEAEFLIPGHHLEFSGVAHHFPLNSNLRAGDIVGIKALKLEVGTGPNRSSVFSSEHRDLSLKAYTQILLDQPSIALIRTAAPLPKSVTGLTKSIHRPAQPAPVPIDTLEVCKPPTCVVDRPPTGTDLDSKKPVAIQLGPFGYGRRSRRLLADFEQDNAMAWLGPDEVLFAFNSHRLVPRGLDSPETARIVHAVLLSVSSHAVLRSADWEIHDSGRFLWQLDSTRILVHAGDKLRVYGSGLELEHTIRLSGPLRFLRASPSGDSIIFGTLRERHSRELHAQLRDELGDEPEEDVEVTMLDKNFQVVKSGIAGSRLTAPTLLNEGQVSLRPQPEGDYRMAIEKWGKTTATLARFRSTCAPQVSSISPDLLFLLSCVTNIGEPEFRVLHADGTLMLRGQPGSQQLGIEGAGNSRRFAVKFVRRLGDEPPGSRFSASDLEFTEIRIYRAEDGRRLGAVRVDDPPTSYGGFALSPDGSQIAVLSGSEIKLFALPDQ